MFFLFLGAALLGFPNSGFAGECALEEDARAAQVREIVDGDTLILDDGREVRLTGIQSPKLPLGRPNFETWPLAPEARATLADLAMGKRAVLRYGGERMDRHGRVLAHIFISAGNGQIWLQQEMLRRGLARVYTFDDNRACSGELLAVEEAARQEGRGIWANSFYGLRDAADVQALMERIGRFELVEGKVTSAALVRDRLYLNFGDDYRQDFTVTVQERNVRLFKAVEPWASLLAEANGDGVSALAGKRIRVRGWLDRYNGPEIEATHPEQIEFLRGAE